MNGKPQSPPTLRRQLSQAVAWNAVFTPIKFIIDTIANLIKVNLLTRAELGAISLVSSAASSAGIWLDLGIEQTLPKFIPEVEHAGGRSAVRFFLRRIISIKLLVLLAGLLTMPLWGGVLLKQIRSGAEQLAAQEGLNSIGPLLDQVGRFGWFFLATVALLIILGALYDTLMAYLISFFRQKAWNIINVFATLALPILTVSAVLLGYGVLGVLAAMVATALLSVLVTWQHVRRISAARTDDAADQPFQGSLWRRFLPYTAMAFFISASEYFSSQYFVALRLGQNLSDVALFWVAYSFIKQIQGYVYTPLQGIQVPLFARVRAAGDHNLPRVFATLARLILVLVIPSSIGLAILLPNLILVQFPTYEASIKLGLVLIPFFFTEPFWGLGHNVLMVHEAYQPVLLSRLCALVSIPLVVVLPPLLGLWGVALAIGISKLAAGLVVVGVATHRYQLFFPWQFALRVLLAGGIMGAVLLLGVWLLGVSSANASINQRITSFAVCLGLTVVGGGCFIAAARMLRLINEEDRVLLADIRNPMAQRLLRLL